MNRTFLLHSEPLLVPFLLQALLFLAALLNILWRRIFLLGLPPRDLGRVVCIHGLQHFACPRTGHNGFDLGLQGVANIP